MDALRQLAETIGGNKPLAQFLGFSEGYVSKVLNGKVPVSRQFAMRAHQRTQGRIQAADLLFPQPGRKS